MPPVALPRSLAVLLAATAAVAQVSRIPAKAGANVGKGYELVQEERYEEAAGEFAKALAADPRLLPVRYQLAVCWFALGRREEARRELEALRVETHEDPAVVYYLARLDLLEDRTSSAIEGLETLTREPPFPDTWYYLGFAYLREGDVPLAIRSLRKAVQAAPLDFRAHERLARAYQKAGRRAEAEAEYARSTELRQSYNLAARDALDCGRDLDQRPLEEARATCRRLFDPGNPDKLTTLGMIYGQHGRYAEALEPLETASRLDPDSFEIQHNLGLTYFRLKRYAEARGPLEKAVSLRAHFFGSNALLGASLYALGEDARAFEVTEQAHALNPRDADTAELLFKLAVLLAKREYSGRNYPQTLAYLQKATALRPGVAELHDRLAEMYTLLGRSEEAESEKRIAKRIRDEC
jgi:tetratricopeptide (TPR) repeat protein